LQGKAEEALVARAARRTIWPGQRALRLDDLDPIIRAGQASRNAAGTPAFGQRTLEQLHSSSDHVLIPQHHQKITNSTAKIPAGNSFQIDDRKGDICRSRTRPFRTVQSRGAGALLQ
jgi:hypothetical protein